MFWWGMIELSMCSQEVLTYTRHAMRTYFQDVLKELASEDTPLVCFQSTTLSHPVYLSSNFLPLNFIQDFGFCGCWMEVLSRYPCLPSTKLVVDQSRNKWRQSGMEEKRCWLRRPPGIAKNTFGLDHGKKQAWLSCSQRTNVACCNISKFSCACTIE